MPHSMCDIQTHPAKNSTVENNVVFFNSVEILLEHQKISH